MIKRITIIAVMILGFIWLAGCEQAPEVSITEPADNATVSGIVEIKATATDNEEVTKVEFYVDGELKGTIETATDSEYSYTWDARDEIPGSKHTIQAKAYDVTDNVGESSVITVKIPHEGTIPYDETWYAADNPHIIVDDVYVEAVLTLEPGVIVKFGPGAGLYVGFDAKGALYAYGTADSPIIFTSNFNPVGPGNWSGITFDRYTIDWLTVLDHCVIEYGGDNGYGNIYCRDALPTITNCTIRHSSTHGVYNESHIEQSGFTGFSGNTITQNAKYPLRIDAEYIRTLGSGNTLTGNAKDGILVGSGGIYNSGEWLNHGVPYIITNELDIKGGGSPILTIAPGSTLRFRGSTGILIGNWAPAALVADGSNAQITFTTDTTPPVPGTWNGITFCDGTIDAVTKLNNCVIEYGGGNNYGNIYCYLALPTITNCTIRYSSKNGVYCGGVTEFSDNTITGNAEYPLRIDAEYVRTLGPGNTLTGNAKDGILVGSGGIYNSGEWLNHGVPYILTHGLSISGSDSPVLTIAPDNTLRFKEGKGISIGLLGWNPGALVADGSSGQITFTADITPPEPGRWNGITFDGNTIDAVTKLNNCVIEYGGGNGKGNIYCNSASPTITNCAINYSSHWGIYLEGESSPTMYGNTFKGNQDGDIGP